MTNNFIPIYQQIKDDIKTAIDNGDYKPQDKIPSELELCEKYEASRITVRRAIEELCADGCLVKMQGKGTFVNAPRIHRKLSYSNIGGRVVSFSDNCRAEGLEPGARVIKVEIVPSRRDEQKFFNLDEDSLLIHIQRIRTASALPILLENHFLPYEKFKELLKTDLTNKSFFETLKNQFNIEVTDTASSTIEIAKATAEQAKLLNIPINDPLFFRNVHFIDSDGNPAVIGRQYYVGSRYMFTY